MIKRDLNDAQPRAATNKEVSQLTSSPIFYRCGCLGDIFDDSNAVLSTMFNRPYKERSPIFISFSIFSFWLIGAGMAIDSGFLSGVGALLGASVVVWFLLSLKPFRKTPSTLLILTIGIVWLLIGLITQAIESFFGIETADLALHIVAMGTILTLHISFWTRLIFGYTRQIIHAD